VTTTEYNNAVETLADRLFRFALKNMKDEALAQDVVQECFEKLWLKKADVDAQKVKSYLFTSAYHKMVDMWRKDKNHGDIQDFEEVVGHQPHTYSGLRPIIEKALDRLPDVQRSVLLLRDYEGYDYAEIGNICDLNESQVKVYIYRARMAMKKYLGSLEAVLG